MANNWFLIKPTFLDNEGNWQDLENTGLSTVYSDELSCSYEVLSETGVISGTADFPAYSVESSFVGAYYVLTQTVTTIPGLTCQYQVRVAVYDDPVTVTYEVRNAESQDLDVTYSVAGPVEQDLEVSYGLQSAVEKDLSAAYTLRERVTQDLDAAYDVETAAGTVFQQIECSYSVAGYVEKDVDVSYKVLDTVSQELLAFYEVRSSVALDTGFSYRLLERVTKDFVGAYSVSGLTAVSRDLLCSYNLFTSGSALVPNVRGLSLSRARTVLENAGFTVGTVTEYS